MQPRACARGRNFWVAVFLTEEPRTSDFACRLREAVGCASHGPTIMIRNAQISGPDRTSDAASVPDPTALDLALLGAEHGSTDQMIADILSAVRMQLRMDVAFISEFENGRRTFRHVDIKTKEGDTCQPPRPGLSHPLEESYCQRLVDGRLPEMIPDTTQEPEAAALPVTDALSIGAYMGVPIRFSDGRLYGTFCCYRDKPDDSLNDRDLGYLRLFSAVAGRLIERQVNLRKERDEMAQRIRRVIDEQRFNMVFQPIVNLEERRVIGYEALTRFSLEPRRTPDLWFDEAGHVGLQDELEATVITKALEGLERFPADAYMSINASPDTILSGTLAKLLHDQPLERLMLEVTEHVSVDDYAKIGEHLAPLRHRGLRLAVDDAGAGYASFRHILKLGPDLIKLDSSLIRRIDCERSNRALAAALIRFAEETGSKIVAEGVETEEELAVLRELKGNNAQGYLLGRPVPLSQVGRQPESCGEYASRH